MLSAHELVLSGCSITKSGSGGPLSLLLVRIDVGMKAQPPLPVLLPGLPLPNWIHCKVLETH